jgi:hypothetical protein
VQQRSLIFAAKIVDLPTATFFSQNIDYSPLPHSWVCSHDKFVEIFLSRRVSAPGPDGFSRSFWAFVPVAVHQVLYDLYLHLLDLGSLPLGFNHPLFAFIPQAELAEDLPFSIVRPASLMRPLSLSNADSKIIATAISSPL